MSVRFTPCPACNRHVKQNDNTCPFCGGLSSTSPPAALIPVRHLSRSALFAASAVGIVLATTDCSSSGGPVYGAPPIPLNDATSGSISPGQDMDAISSKPGDAAAEGGFSTAYDDAGDAELTDGGSLEATYGAAPVHPTDDGNGA